MKTYVAPSILSADFNVLGAQIKEIEDAGVKYLHVDVMDGMFVPSISFGMPVIRSIRKNSNLFFDVHLMIEDPIRYIDEFASSGADSITFHLEAKGADPGEVIEKIKATGKKVGISIKPKTPVEELRPYINDVDMILIMTVEPGFGGQAYIDYCTQKVKDTRKMLDDAGLDIHIQVDGGISEKTIKIPYEAGANIFVAGSAAFNGNLTENINKLQDLV